MEKRIIVFCGLLLLISSCKKETLEVFNKGSQSSGYMKAKRAGFKWEASGFARASLVKANSIVIEGYTYSELNEYRENVPFHPIPAKKGKYIIDEKTIHSAYHRIGADGDVFVAFYDVDLEEDNYIEIEKIDLVNKTVEGNFCCHYKRIADDGSADFPDKVTFSKGCFDIKIE